MIECPRTNGPVAQRQSRGLIIPWSQVRILAGPDFLEIGNLFVQQKLALEHHSDALKSVQDYKGGDGETQRPKRHPFLCERIFGSANAANEPLEFLKLNGNSTEFLVGEVPIVPKSG